MTFTRISFTTILFCGALALLISCSGQAIPTKTTPEKKNNVGTIVSELDKSIWTIFQDKKNNYWFGSNQNGLYCYDGKILKHFTTKDRLCSNQIRGIQEDQLGHIYFETPVGISKYDGKTFTSLVPVKSFVNEWKLQPDDLWFKRNGESIGAFRYDGSTLYELEFSTLSSKKFDSNHAVYAIYKDKKGYVWFATLNGGVGCYNGATLTWIYENEMGTLEDGRVPGIRSVLQDKDDSFWFSNTLYQYNISDSGQILQKTIAYKRLKKIDLSKQPVKMDLPYYTSAVFDNETLWMTCYNDGVWKYDGEILTNYSIKDGDTKVLPMFVIKDHQGFIWVGTDNAGVYKFNGNAFEKFKP